MGTVGLCNFYSQTFDAPGRLHHLQRAAKVVAAADGLGGCMASGDR
jgi:hypothetical protein